ncbi:hypothetical protein FACS1894200_04900 [Spirochaetia bacterium]|nr:hypothetical protein FACS1894200_04900 [Spirochaetia bacterium]
MNMIDISNKVDSIVDDLFISFDAQQVESVFTKHEIVDYQDRINLLRKCMKVIDTSNADEELPIEDEYHDELAIFVKPMWRFLI